jgi:diacylglycerol kinase (ATP)
MQRVHLLVNPTRSAQVGATERIVEELNDRHCEVVELRPPDVGSVATTIRHHLEPGIDRLIIAGGDGLIHRALPALAHSGVVVGIVGVGTGNDFARALGLPRRIPAAVDAALADPIPIDLIETDTGSLAATVVTGGFSGQVNDRANHLPFPPGQQRYTVATLLELPRLRTVELRLTVDDQTHDLTTTLFAVANTPFFGGGMAICPDAAPTDGALDVTVVGPTSRLLLARMLPTVFSGRHVRHPAVTTYRGTRIELDTSTPLWADGEPFSCSALAAAPGALLVAGSLGAI